MSKLYQTNDEEELFLFIRIPCLCGKLVLTGKYNLGWNWDKPVCKSCARKRTKRTMEITTQGMR